MTVYVSFWIMTKPKLFTKEQVLSAIKDWIIENGFPPTVDELRRILRSDQHTRRCDISLGLRKTEISSAGAVPEG